MRQQRRTDAAPAELGVDVHGQDLAGRRLAEPREAGPDAGDEQRSGADRREVGLGHPSVQPAVDDLRLVASGAELADRAAVHGVDGAGVRDTGGFDADRAAARPGRRAEHERQLARDEAAIGGVEVAQRDLLGREPEKRLTASPVRLARRVGRARPEHHERDAATVLGRAHRAAHGVRFLETGLLGQLPRGGRRPRLPVLYGTARELVNLPDAAAVAPLHEHAPAMRHHRHREVPGDRAVRFRRDASGRAGGVGFVR